MKIGWIGLGNMGIPMVKNLIRSGFSVVLYNRTASKAAPLQELGATLAESPAVLLATCDIVITMVSDDEALRQVHDGENGLLSGGPGGKDGSPGSDRQPGVDRSRIVIDMSTVSPATSRELAERLAAKGIAYLDAPVSGSVKPAEDGQLVIMVGGKKEDYEKALPIFGCLGKRSFLLGNQGSGNVAKLAINLLLAFNVQGLAETVLFAQDNGIATGDMLAIINESALANGITRLKANNILENNFKAAFALKHLAKDLRLAKEQGLQTAAGLLIQDEFRRALADGLGDQDIIAMLNFLKK
ncbi:MAG TPA: NAD(P)-dependent oxidoreductase [Puia sp.]|nr:NAD(P)-dependent oxidoreductase [Puia sp.]